MATRSPTRIDESNLTKAQRRKLDALRRSVGDEIGNRAFVAWLSAQPAAAAEVDENAVLIAETLWALIEDGRLAIPRGGYLVRRGHGRVVVEKARG